MQPEQWISVIEEYVGTRTEREKGALLKFASGEGNMMLLEKYVRLAMLRERQQMLAEQEHESIKAEKVTPAKKGSKHKEEAL